MNLVLLEQKDFIGSSRARLTGRRFEHLKRVNRVKKSDRLACGLLNGKTGSAEVTKLSADSLELDICLENDPPEPLPLILVLALPRPKMLKRIIESVTSLGVKQIYLINSWRVEKSFWESPVLDQDNLRKYMILGLEQGADTLLPEIHQRRFFTPFVKEEIPEISKGCLCITAHPKATKKCPTAVNRDTVLAVGPEGGFIEREIETFESMGSESCSLGRRILRVETAVTYLISRLFI